MHSLKNTFVAVVLLGVSYFVYNGITNPAADPGSEEAGLGLNLEMPEGDFTETVGDVASDAKAKIGESISDFSKSLGDFKAPPLHSALNRQTTQQDSQEVQAQPSHFNKSLAQGDFAPNTNMMGGSQDKSAEPLTQFNNQDQFQRNTNRQPQTETQLGSINPRGAMHQAHATPSTIDAQNSLQLAVHTDGAFTSTAATLDMAWPHVDELVNGQKYRQALSTLSHFYGADNLSNDDQAKLLEWLDALAGKVIYSSEHNLATSAYVIQANDTMQSIADQWGVPAQLVYNVNQAKIANPLTLTPGNELKIIEGPFHAKLDSDETMLTLFLGDLYAGRFQINLLNPPAAGQYRVTSKVANGGTMGSFEVQLTNTATGSKCSLHASSAGQGSIGLTAGDAQDLFGILSDESVVTIR